MSHPIHQAIIIGAGFGGLGQGAQFVRDGVDDFVILERAADLGGVWRDNTYPGAACDTQSVIYCYSYFLHVTVSRMFAGQAELLQYLRRLAEQFDLTRRLRLGHEVVSATWVGDERHWLVETARGEQFRSRALVAAWGQLSEPYSPHIDGLDSFEGEIFHSARWRHDLDLAGLRVASIGAAATAVQFVPEVAKEAAELHVYQRSANYILPRDQRLFSEQETSEFVADPARYRRLRHDIHETREAGFARTLVDSAASGEGVALARAHLEKQVADPRLRELLTPDYEFGCKRILRSDDFYPALTQPHVHLIADPITSITRRGIRTADGTHREVDVLILATGFKSQSFQGALRVVGRDGQSLDERWGSAPEAHLGIAVDGFPNMFLVYGPNTNLNHNSVVAMLEAQHRYISQGVTHLTAAHVVLEVRANVLRSFNTRVQEALERSAYSADCSSWYKNAEGRVVNNWSGTVEEYQSATSTLNLDDYVLTS